MESVLITANIDVNKRSEFYQVMESLKNLVKGYCNDFETIISDKNRIYIQIIFDKKEDLENNFNNKEFNMLKGTVRSLCKNIFIKINGVIDK